MPSMCLLSELGRALTGHTGCLQCVCAYLHSSSEAVCDSQSRIVSDSMTGTYKLPLICALDS